GGWVGAWLGGWAFGRGLGCRLCGRALARYERSTPVDECVGQLFDGVRQVAVAGLKIDGARFAVAPGHGLELSAVGEVGFQNSKSWSYAIQQSFDRGRLVLVVVAVGTIRELGYDGANQQVLKRAIRARSGNFMAQMIDRRKGDLVGQGRNDQAIGGPDGRFSEDR